MPTILSHPAAALGFAPFGRTLSRGAVACGVLLTILPDVDVAGFKFGIPYGSMFGHRGITHSILFALLAATVAWCFTARHFATWLYFFACAVSHGVLDAMTNGGRGIAFFAPFSNHRYFLPWRPIRVSPIGALDLAVVRGEMLTVWLPFLAIGMIGLLLRRR